MFAEKPGVRALIAADAAALKRARNGELLAHLYPHLFAVVAFRVAHQLGKGGFPRIAHLVSVIAQTLTGAEIGWTAEIGPGLVLDHPLGVIVADRCVAGRSLRMGAGVILGYTAWHPASDPSQGCPTIGDNVEIWARATVAGPISVGDGARVGAHALVLDDVPAGAVARGVPARSYIDGRQVPKRQLTSSPTAA
jgi:serine O-acetyltransferase